MEYPDIHKYTYIYFLGIGGIGMSALARYFLSENIKVAGYDRTQTSLTGKLESEGMKIQYIDSVETIPEGIDLVVRTPAVPVNSNLYRYFKESGIPMLKRAEVLGLISHSSHCLAVAGTHGKTTTSTLLAYLLRSGGDECSALLGGISVDFDGNFIKGTNHKVVVEADEYDRSFLHLRPDRAVLTSMDPDHLDIYGDTDTIRTSFLEFCRLTDRDGMVLIHHSLKDYFNEWSGAPVATYGIDAGEYKAVNVRPLGSYMVFDLVTPDRNLIGLQMPFPGLHNVENAIAAISLALEEGIHEDAIRDGLRKFKGIRRRFERIYESDDKVFIDDYAHHPTELEAAIQAAKAFYPGRKLTGIFQPHLFTRTRDFAEGFAKALDKLDECILMEIYPAREEPIEGVNSEMILRLMENSEKKLVKRENIIPELKNRKIDLLLTLGAGDIDKEVIKIKEALFI
jgi:UDP-N-acetylmuramate--alanine ligase